jgi:hypothetical protein
MRALGEPLIMAEVLITVLAVVVAQAALLQMQPRLLHLLAAQALHQL